MFLKIFGIKMLPQLVCGIRQTGEGKMATQLDAEEGKSSRSKASLTKINNKK